MPTTLEPPPTDRRPWGGDDLPPTPPPPPRGTGGGPPTPPPRRRVPVAVLLTLSALLGGGVSAGVLAGTGALDRTVTRTVTQTSAVSDTTPSGSSDGLDAEAIYASTSPGTVSITATGVTSADQASSQSPFGGPQEQSESTATGTGFLYDTEGHILTAEHVVNGASSVVVELQDGTKRKATVLGTDDATDVAVLKIDASSLNLHALTLGSSSGLDIGQSVAAIGDPFGYERSISTGVASGIDRTVSAPNGFTVAHAIQTDAALNPGNSGGPLVDANGKVIGIVDQIATNGGADQSSGVGFAVPIDLVAKELSALESGGTVKHAYIGLGTSSATTSASGALVGSVVAGGPAADAGLEEGDLITAIGGTKVDGPNALVAAIADHKPGDSIKVTVRRNGETSTETVTLGTQPAQSATTTG